MAEYKDSNIIVRTSNKSRSAVLVFLLIIIIAIAGIITYRYMTRPVSTGDVAEYIVPTRTSPGTGGEFDDGLKIPDSATKYELDEFGEGLASTEIFNIDINADGKKDRIIRSRHENGTSHFYYEYKIELNTANGFSDITPRDFRTVEGAECALQKIRFIFAPQFGVEKISRQWQDSWVTPTMATKSVYKISGNRLEMILSQKLKEICDVSELF